MGLWYRAMCFNKPVGPWRSDKRLAREDLIDCGLGEYTEWGSFYITVPGDMQCAYDHQIASIIRAA